MTCRVTTARTVLWILAIFAAVEMRPSARLMAYEGQSSIADERSNGSVADGSRGTAILRSTAARLPDIPFSAYEQDSVQTLLDLANEARKRAKLQPLKLDEGLSQAARVHAEAMLQKHQLSHQFDGEASLPQRLAVATQLQLEQEGENVAVDVDAAGGHRHLMLSPPHRENLLNASYNVVGIAAIRSGEQLYIVQDFGRALPTYSLAEVKERVAGTLARTRQRGKQPRLASRPLPDADEAACSMAHEDSLGTPAVRRLASRYTILSYTTLHPEELPLSAMHAISSHSLLTYSVGACYARTQTYPTGVYWLVVAFE